MSRNISEPSQGADIANLGFRTRQLERASQPSQYEIKIFSDTQTVTTGDGKFIFVTPVELNGSTLFSAQAFVTTASSSIVTVQVRNVSDVVDMLSTPITIDAGEYHSYFAETPAVVDAVWFQPVPPSSKSSNADVSTGDRIAIDVDVGGGKGLGVILRFGRNGNALPAIPNAPVPSVLNVNLAGGQVQTTTTRRGTTYF
jgi:hypothetical protein